MSHRSLKQDEMTGSRQQGLAVRSLLNDESVSFFAMDRVMIGAVTSGLIYGLLSLAGFC